MRKTRTDQVSIFDWFSNHDIGKELKAMSERLDRYRETLEWVAMVHAPSDSTLLWDSVRVMVRLLAATQSMPGTLGLNFATIGDARSSGPAVSPISAGRTSKPHCIGI